MKRKLMKLLILTIIVSIFIIAIYKTSKENKINIVVLGEEISEDYAKLKDYLDKENRLGTFNKYKSETLNNLTYYIKKESSIKKDLRESKLVIVSISINNYLDSLKELLKEIKRYAQYDVFLIGNYDLVPSNSSESKFKYMYQESIIKDMAKKLNIIYLSRHKEDIFNEIIKYIK